MNVRIGSISAGILAFLILFPLSAEPIDELIEKAYKLDVRLMADDALKLYLQAEKENPQNVEVLLAIARQYRHLMADAGSKREKLELGRLALAYDERSAKLAPNSSNAQLSEAITYGKMMKLLSTKEQVAASKKLKAAAEEAVRLDPDNDTGWHLLGRWHAGVAELSPAKRAVGELLFGKLPESSYEAAAACFEKALAANPDRLMHYVELGGAYAAMGRIEEAREYLIKGLAMPGKEKDDPESKQRAQETLGALN